MTNIIVFFTRLESFYILIFLHGKMIDRHCLNIST